MGEDDRASRILITLRFVVGVNCHINWEQLSAKRRPRLPSPTQLRLPQSCLNMIMYILCLCLVVSFLWFIVKTLLTSSPKIEGQHVLITGGSSGIGKSFAIDAAARGANVSLLARDKTKLEAAQAEVSRHLKNKDKQTVRIYSVDISKDYKEVERVVQQAEAEMGPVSLLINCAGYSYPSRFDEIPVEEFQNLMSVNYMGSVYVTRAVVPGMKAQRSGRIMFVSSQAGVIGVYGFTAYSASKFALRGLAEALHMEVAAYNISVTLGLPPDTDTPGFEEENKVKPIETKLISESSGLWSPNNVAKALMEDCLQGKFLSSVGLEGSLMCTLCAGMAPMTSISELITQMFAMGTFRLVGVLIMAGFHRTINQQLKAKDQNKKDG